MITIVYAGDYEVQAMYEDGQKRAVYTSPSAPHLGAAFEMMTSLGLGPEYEEISKFATDDAVGFNVFDAEAWPATLADALRMLTAEAAGPVTEREEEYL